MDEEIPSELSTPEQIETTKEITLKHVIDCLELGMKHLPSIEIGTKFHGGSERKNREARIKYLKDNLDIEADTIPHPLKSGKTLPSRLVADVLLDFITLSQTINTLPQDDDPQLFIDLFNSLTKFRQEKGSLIDINTSKGETYRTHGLENQYSPGRSDNLIRNGYLKNIFEALEKALKKKYPPSNTPPAAPPASAQTENKSL